MTVCVEMDVNMACAHFPALPASVGQARRFVRQTLATSGANAWAEAAELVVSEAVTNALVHAGTSIDLAVSVSEDGIRLEVGDDSPHLPQRRRYAATAGTGRGVMLIDEFTSSWGIVARPPGKIVWFDLRSPQTSSPDEVVQPVRQRHAHQADPFPANPRPSGPTTGTSRNASAGRTPARPESGSTSSTRPGRAETVAVHLSRFPALLYLAWREYAETLLREFLLARLDLDHDDDAVRVHAQSSGAMALIAEHVHAPTLSDDPVEVLQAATEPAMTAAEHEMFVPLTAVPHFVTLNKTLDAAGALAESGTFFTPPIQPELRQFRRWLCQEVASQARNGAPRPWASSEHAPAPRSFAPLLWEGEVTVDSDEAVVAADDSNGIVAVSAKAAEMLGYEGAEDLVGQRLVAIVPDRYRQAHVAGFTLHLLNGRSALLGMPVTLPVLRRSGEEVMASVTIERHRTPDGRAVFVATLSTP